MRTLFPVLWVLTGCVVEEEQLSGALDDVFSDEAWELPVDAAGPPPVAASVERASGQLAPGVFLAGDVVRMEAPVVGGRLVPGRARCAWQFSATAVLPTPVVPGGAVWAFTVQYRPVADLLLQATGVPSVCSAAVFPAGPGVPFTQPLALDANLNQILKETPAGWAPFGPNLAPIPAVPGGRPGFFDWRGVLRVWP